jgi:hypothetical protein
MFLPMMPALLLVFCTQAIAIIWCEQLQILSPACSVGVLEPQIVHPFISSRIFVKAIHLSFRP